MLKVHEVSRLAGVSIRTLHYYDQIGLLKPTVTTDAGYRLYDDNDLERLQHILLYRELQFSLKDIRDILDSPDFDREIALEQQIQLLEMRREHLENLIAFARGIKKTGVDKMDFSAFDTKKIDEYTKEAKERWGHTDAWNEFEEKHQKRSSDMEKTVSAGIMCLFTEFGTMMNLKPEDELVQDQVKKLQEYITKNYYNCTEDILAGLGQMYVTDERMMNNIDLAGGKGTAAFAAEAIRIYCGK